MRVTIAELIAILAMDATRFEKGIKVAETAATRLGKNLEKIGKRGMKMITLPILAIGTASVKMAMDFETQITSLYTIMDEATIQSRDWGQEVLDLSRRVGESTDVLAAGLYDLIGSGIDAAKAMGVLEIASKAAKAGQTDTATAVKALAAVLNSYSLDASKAEEVADTLFATVNFGIIKFEELAQGIGRVLPVAAAAGISLDELGAAITVMTLGGLNANMSMTALNAVILNFLKPAEQAVEAAAELGIDLSAAALSGDGLYGTVMKITKALGLADDEIEKLSDSTLTEAQIQTVLAEKLGTTTEKIAMMFPNVRALIGFLSLAKKGGEEFTKQIENMGLAPGSTEAAFKKFATTTKFQFDLMTSSLKATGIEIGTKLLPMVNKLFKGVGDLAGKFGKLSDAGQTAVITIGGIAATVPVLLYVTGKVMGLVIQFKALGIAITTAKLAALGLTGVLIGLLGYTKILRSSVDSTEEAYEKFGHGLGITEDDIKDIIEAEEELKTSIEGVTEEIDKNIETIKEWGSYAPNYLSILDALKRLYKDDEITAEGYNKTLQYLISTQGMFTGSAQEVIEKAKYIGRDFDLVAMAADRVSGVVKDGIPVLDKFGNVIGEAGDEAEGSIPALDKFGNVIGEVGDEADETERSISNLISTMFLFFNLSQATTEAEERYLEEVKKLEEMQKTRIVTSGGGAEAKLANINAQENLTKKTEKYNKVISDEKSTEKEVLEVTIALTKAKKGADEATNNLTVTTKTYTASEKEVEAQLRKVQDAGESMLVSIAEEIQVKKISGKETDELIGKYLKYTKASIERGETDVAMWWETTRELEVASEEIGNYLLDIGGKAVESGDITQEQLKEMVREFNSMGKEIGLEIDVIELGFKDLYFMGETLTGQKVRIDLKDNFSDVLGRYQHLQRSLKDINRTVIYRTMGPGWTGVIEGAMGGIVRGDKGAIIGAPHAAFGYVTPQTGREIPVIAHEGEVILNTSEQGNIARWIMNKATTRPEGVGGVGDIKNIFNIAELIVREEADVENVAEVLFEKQEKFLRGVGNK